MSRRVAGLVFEDDEGPPPSADLVVKDGRGHYNDPEKASIIHFQVRCLFLPSHELPASEAPDFSATLRA